MQTRSIMFAMISGRPRLTRSLDYSLAVLITLNVVATIFETVPWVEQRWGWQLNLFDWLSVAVFTVEYVIRLALCKSHPSGRFSHSIKGRLRYAMTPMAVVDLLAVLPFYFAAVTALDLRFLRALRLFRIFKLTRYSSAMTALLEVLRDEARSFGAALFILIVILILAASGIYLVEHDMQPEAFGSIPAAMWWAVSTLTTVGYGDVTPITSWGKVFGAAVTIVGVGMVALPAGILASAFADLLRRRREEYKRNIREALADGELTAKERKRLAGIRKSLGIDEEDAKRMLDGATTVHVCPRCGFGGSADEGATRNDTTQ